MNITQRLVEFLARRGRSQHSVFLRTVAMVLGATVFAFLIPAFVLWAGKVWLSQPLVTLVKARTLASVCFILGLPWMLWAIGWQLSQGKGTPVPVVPPTQFLPDGPYRHVRNPMILGFALYLLGWAFLVNSLGAFIAAGGIIAFLLTEIKCVEEHELEARFGDSYRQYKERTPFILPKIKL